MIKEVKEEGLWMAFVDQEFLDMHLFWPLPTKIIKDEFAAQLSLGMNTTSTIKVRVKH